MPGRRINEYQIGLYMKYRNEGQSQKTASAKAGFCERSARSIENRDYQLARSPRKWRTRPDPFAEVWESELLPKLEQEPKLQAKTLLEDLQERYPGKYSDKQLRTLERRVKQWRATKGPEKEIIFRQNHPPGWQGLSDFTDASSLEIRIQGELLEHRLYHYRLSYSGWEYANVVLGGESYSALTENLQKALWQSQGAPLTHRTDSLSAAFRNLTKEAIEDQTRAYHEFCSHYGMEPTRNNKGVSHENGSIEVSHKHLKNRVDQALLIRGSRDFSSVDDYKEFLREVTKKHNRRVHKVYLEELAALQSLPEGRAVDFAEERVRVTTSSTIMVKNSCYSVPSRLIGSILKVHVYDDRLECFVGGDHTLTLERVRSNKRRGSNINYRHLIGQLVRKPGAFQNYVYQHACFPTLAFRQAWEWMQTHYSSREACREYVGILAEAAKDDREQTVSLHLERSLLKGTCPKLAEIRALFHSHSTSIPVVESDCDSLESYAQLLAGGES